MKTILNRLIQHEVLDKKESKEILYKIADGQYNTSQISAFLTVYMMRSISIKELEGFRDALLELCIHINLDEFDPIDLCGTGGDNKDTFNISTLASFVTAGAGIKVAKHGNYGVSSKCGSSNVMEYLGIKFSNDEGFLKKCIEKAGICILHAPLFHPAMKNVAPIRKELAVKTFFNMLGPMVNPSFPKNQIVGVFSLELARVYGYIYQNSNKNFNIIHSLDGYDEVSLTGSTKLISNSKEELIEPKDFGLTVLNKEEIKGGNSIESSAKIFFNVLSGKGTNAQNQVVCANSALAIATKMNITPKEGYKKAEESLVSGNAMRSLISLQKLSS
jgi:anthranilate phosphoribosyltransferase|tara:strand:+ start:6686 stop:7678 length:993 start_codon:yes stop_codon:yes gene_type:complete